MARTRLKRAKQIQDRIRQVLYNDWDPIGICDDGPEDEYDAYIGGIYSILAGSRSEDALISYMSRVENDMMGLSRQPGERLKSVARRLLELDVKL